MALLGVAHRYAIHRVEQLEMALKALVDRYDSHIGETVSGYSRISALEASMRTLIANGGRDRFEALKDRIERIERGQDEMRKGKE